MSLADDILEPLVLADGTKIDPSNGRVIKDRKEQRQFISIPGASEAQAIVARSRRGIAELPLAPKNMNAVSLVLFYTMWGLQDQDIAITIGITTEQIKNIKKLEQYTTFSNDIKRSVLEHDATDIRNYFQGQARNAAVKVVEIMDDDDGALGFAAAKDVLDRAGMRPADVVEHRHSMSDALRIEHIVRGGNAELPALEAAFTVVDEG